MTQSKAPTLKRVDAYGTAEWSRVAVGRLMAVSGSTWRSRGI